MRRAPLRQPSQRLLYDILPVELHSPLVRREGARLLLSRFEQVRRHVVRDRVDDVDRAHPYADAAIDATVRLDDVRAVTGREVLDRLRRTDAPAPAAVYAFFEVDLDDSHTFPVCRAIASSGAGAWWPKTLGVRAQCHVRARHLFREELAQLVALLAGEPRSKPLRERVHAKRLRFGFRLVFGQLLDE